MARESGLPISDEILQLLLELSREKVPYMIVGMAAAIIQGSDASTKDIDLWFRSTSHPGVDRAARNSGGSFVWRTTPQTFTGPGLDDVDIVFKCGGLLSFDEEYVHAVEVPLTSELTVKVLPIDRVIVSKKAANRQKDWNVMSALEATLAALREKE